MLMATSSMGYTSIAKTRSYRSTALSMSADNKRSNFFENLPKKAIPALIGAALLTFNPSDSLALQSGGRSGGSSFRSAPRSSTRSYSSNGYGGGAYRSSPSFVPVPMYSPFSYGFGGFGGFGISPFSFIPINLNVLLLGAAAYAIYNVLQNRVGSSDFSNFEDGGALGDGASIVKLQVSLDADWSKDGNIMQTMADLAARKGIISGRSDISSLLSEASVALLRRQNDWSAVSFDTQEFRRGESDRAEPAFQRLAIQERTKFEKESMPGAAIRSTSIGYTPTQAVVSLVVAIRGRSDTLKKKMLSSRNDVREVLQTLASEALTDEGDNVMAVEVSNPSNNL